METVQWDWTQGLQEKEGLAWFTSPKDHKREGITGLLIISSKLGKEGIEKEMRLEKDVCSHIKKNGVILLQYTVIIHTDNTMANK